MCVYHVKIYQSSLLEFHIRPVCMYVHHTKNNRCGLLRVNYVSHFAESYLFLKFEMLDGRPEVLHSCNNNA